MSAIPKNPTRVSEDSLVGLEPLVALSRARLRELADVCVVERVASGADPFRIRGLQGQSVYPLSRAGAEGRV
jgi:hypothetical protein